MNHNRDSDPDRLPLPNPVTEARRRVKRQRDLFKGEPRPDRPQAVMARDERIHQRHHSEDDT